MLLLLLVSLLLPLLLLPLLLPFGPPTPTLPHSLALAHSLPRLQGETWSIGAGGERYNKWWGENHFGGGLVQKFGSSNTGGCAGREWGCRVRVA